MPGTSKRPPLPKVTLSLDAEMEKMLQDAMEESGIRAKSRLVRYCIAATLGRPLHRQAVFEIELWFRQMSLLVFRRFAGRFSGEIPVIVEEVLANEGLDLTEGEDADED